MCEAFDAGHQCVRGSNGEAIDASVQPEPDAPPRSEVVVFPEDIGPIGFRKPMGELAYAPAFDESGVELEGFSLSEFRTNDTRWGDYDFLVIMHGAQWCGPCQLMLRALDEDAGR